MQAVILCGGRGTRLHEETSVRPKPMVSVGDHPILWHIMRNYRAYGVRDFVLCLGYKGEVIRDYFLNYRAHNGDIEVDLSTGGRKILREDKVDWRVRLVDTSTDSQTAARLRIASAQVEADCCFVTYGDGVSTVDLDK